MMKKLQCELCGSLEILKTADNLFQCQHCGCKYTFDQAKSLISGTVVAMSPDFEIVAGELTKYNGTSTEIKIPDGVKIIKEHAFENMPALKSVYMPDSIIELGSWSFASCRSLQTVRLSKGLKIIGGSAFSGCTLLNEIEIPSSVETIGSMAFDGCIKLSVITGMKGLKLISEKAFSNCESLETFCISDSVEDIQGFIFDGCKNIKNIVIPDVAIKINTSAFNNCKGLTHIVIPDSIQFYQFDEPLIKKLFPDEYCVPPLEGIFTNCPNIKSITCSRKIESEMAREVPNAFVNGKVCSALWDGAIKDATCPKCGGRIKGLFKKRCSTCGMEFRD